MGKDAVPDITPGDESSKATIIDNQRSYGELMNTMRFFMATICAAALAVWLTGAAFAADEFDSIKKTYSQINTVDARFQQKIFITSLKRERETKGQFYYKRHKGFLWQYTAPREKVFLYDGKAVWQAEEEKDFVIREKIDREKMEGNFLDLVDDVTRLDRLFTLKQVRRQDDLAMLELAPKKDGTIKSARIWVDSAFIIKKMEITEITGNVNIIEFTAIKINQPVSDSLFVFKPGKKEIVER
jgi:chaperone LolA